ncbi:MAG: helix-turn-helix transcriptional regulator [Kineosporiaceae bacterium]|nr:helix-turn-helix transcriptional regulator [Aeromicrobium sp.]
MAPLALNALRDKFAIETAILIGNRLVAKIDGVDLLFRALGNPTRLALLEELGSRNDQTLFELCIRLISRGHRMSRQAVAKHLAVLRDAGLIRLSTSGRTTIHHLDTVALAEARAWIDHLVKGPVTTALLDDTRGNLIQIASMP